MSKRFASNIKSTLSMATAGIVAGSFCLAFLLAVLLPSSFTAWNNRAIDSFMRLRYRLAGKQEVSPYLIHAVINDNSQQALELPSWDRSVFGRVLNTLQETPVKLVACDVFFKDPSFAENDRLLLEASDKSKRVIFPILVYPQDYGARQEPGGSTVETGSPAQPYILKPRITGSGQPPVGATVIPPFGELERRALGLGHINYIPDRDGRCRRVPLLYRYGDGYIPAFSLKIVLEFLDISEDSIEVDFGRHIILRGARIREDLVQDVVIPIDRHGQIIVNFAAPWEDSFLSFPVHKLLAAVRDDEARSHLFDLMDGALVVFSDVSTTNRDYGPGIFESVYPLSGIHVTVVNSILTRNFLADQPLTVTITFTLVFAVALWLLAVTSRGLWFSLGCVGLYALFTAFCLLQFVAFNRVPQLAAPSLGFFFVLVAVNVHRIFIVEKERTAYRVKSEANQKLETVNRELIRQKRDLEAANRKLAEMDRFKTRFVQNITHELRTPLTLIIEPLESIWSHGTDGLSDFAVKNLSFMRKHTHRLLDLVNRFLDLSRFEAGKARLEVESVELVGHLHTLLARFEPAAQQKGVQLSFTSSADSFPAWFDADKLDTIFTNLLSNALKATEADDRIEIAVRAPRNGSKPAAWTPSGNMPLDQMVQIEVRDTGSGIPEGDIPHIFERFHQVDHPSVKAPGGSGVGLSLVRECVSIHRGRISVESRLGAGSRFTVALPWAREHYHPEEITPGELAEPVETGGDIGYDAVTLQRGSPKAFVAADGEANSPGPPLQAALAPNPAESVRTISGKYPDEPILIVDDEVDLLENYRMQLEDSGIDNLILCRDGKAVLPLLRKQEVSIIILDLSLPGVSGKRLLEQVRENHPANHVLVITGLQDVALAVECMKLGAFDYMVKPVELSHMLAKIEHCLDKRNLEKQIDALSQKIQSAELRHPEAFAEIITRDKTMLSRFRYIEAIAESNNPVLITGESGVGKELIARAIHRLSNRTGTFVCENIAGLDDTMISDALFGHAKGAFTDAEGVRRGLVEEAAGGTLFLDEIGDLSGGSQVKLLRFIEQNEYRPLGADKVRVSDARIIIATNANLKEKLEAGTFRKDLFYRLTHQIHVPPLRERRNDLPHLVEHFASRAAEALHFKTPAVPEELLPLLQSYDFPGNVRELKNMIENAVSRTQAKSLPISFFKEYLVTSRGGEESRAPDIQAEGDLLPLPERLLKLRELEEYAVAEALKRSRGNQNIAARLLGLSPSALSRRIKKMGGKKGW